MRTLLAVIGVGISLGTLASGNETWLALGVLCVALAVLFGENGP